MRLTWKEGRRKRGKGKENVGNRKEKRDEESRGVGERGEQKK